MFKSSLKVRTKLVSSDLVFNRHSAMNVIRMIKLFGWEKKIEDRIAEKREEELVWLWRKQALELAGTNVKLVS